MNSLHRYNTFNHRSCYPKSPYNNNFDSNSTINPRVSTNLEKIRQHSLSSFDQKKYFNLSTNGGISNNNNATNSTMKMSAIHPNSYNNSNAINGNNANVADVPVYDGRYYVKKYVDKYENQVNCKRMSFDESNFVEHQPCLDLKLEDNPHSSIKVKFDKSPISSTTIQTADFAAPLCVKNAANNNVTMTTVTVTTPSPNSADTTSTTTIINEKKLKSSTVANFNLVENSNYDFSNVIETFENNVRGQSEQKHLLTTEPVIYQPHQYKQQSKPPFQSHVEKPNSPKQGSSSPPPQK
jgi:hypothetical protein